MVLIIDTSKENGNAIADIMRFMGFLAYATTPLTALGEYSNLYSAVIISNPERFPDIEDYVRRLRLLDSRISLFSISAGVNPHPELFNINFKNSIYSSTLAREITEFAAKHGPKSIGLYRTHDISVCAGERDATYNEQVIDFSKTELRIVKFLAHTTPKPQMTETIIKYIYSPYKHPEHSGLRSHISRINSKFRELGGKNLIEMKPKEGYLLLDIPHVEDCMFKSLSMYF